MMDPANLTFYAIVCGTLAAYVPSAEQRWARAAIGLVVGLIASATLPYLKQMIGLG